MNHRSRQDALDRSVSRGRHLTALAATLLLLVVSSHPAECANTILGPPGYGPEHWVAVQTALPYQVLFENLAQATAPAQSLRLVVPIPPAIDLATVTVEAVGFGTHVIEPPPGLSSYATEPFSRTSACEFASRSAST